MKKITMIFLALLSLNLFAAFQYQVSGYGGGYFSFDGTTSLKMDRPGVHKGLDYLFVKNSLVLRRSAQNVRRGAYALGIHLLCRDLFQRHVLTSYLL